MHQVPNNSPSLPSFVSRQQVVHSISKKDWKHHAPQNHSTTTMNMLIAPKISSMNYTKQTIYHYAQKPQQKE